MKKLTKTQAALLNVLRAVRDHADETEEKDNARAMGGLTANEKFCRGALICVGHSLISSYEGRPAAARNVKVSTFHALEDLGLAERMGSYVRATKQKEGI